MEMGEGTDKDEKGKKGGRTMTLSTSCKQGATAPISPQDCYKHARHEQDEEEEEKDEEDEENDEDNEDDEDEVDEDVQGESDDDPTKSKFSEFLI